MGEIVKEDGRLEQTVFQDFLLAVQLSEVVGDEVLVCVRRYVRVVLDAPFGGCEAFDARGFAGVDQVPLDDVVDVEMDDEKGQTHIETFEVRGELFEIIVVDFLVEHAWNWMDGRASPSEDCDIVLSGADWGAQKLCCDVWSVLGRC